MKALERKEQQARRSYDRAMQRSNSTSNNDTGATISPEEEFMSSVEEAKKATLIMTENMIGSAGGVFNKFKSFGFRSPTSNYSGSDDKKDDSGVEKVDVKNNNTENIYTEEIDFAMPKSPKRSQQGTDVTNNQNDENNTSKDLFDLSDAPAPPVIEKGVEDISVDDLFNLDDTGVTTTPNFTIDDDDEFSDFLS